MARERTVFGNRELPHIWWHGNQSRGRNGKDNFYFRNSIIYSYGDHFLIAAKVTSKNGERGVLINNRTYSHSTNMHQSCTLSAIPNSVPRFHINLTLEDTRNMRHEVHCKDYRDRIWTAYEKGVRARTHKEFHIKAMLSAHKEAVAYAEFFGLKETFELPMTQEECSQAMAEGTINRAAYKEKAEARRALETAIEKKLRQKKERAQKAEAKKRAARLAQDIIDWRAGEIHYMPIGFSGTMLRIRRGMVQTSRGAEFPIHHARRALKLIQSVMASGEPWKSNGHTCKLGIYTLDAISMDGTVTAGCHTVTWAEIERLIPELEAIPESQDKEEENESDD